MKNVAELKYSAYPGPSLDIYIELKPTKLVNVGILTPRINLRLSKLLPVYIMDTGYSIKLNKLDPKLDLWGPAQTFDLLESVDQIEETLKDEGYLELSEHDRHDTVFEWHEVPNIDPWNRRLTLEMAAFEDVLNLCG